VNNLLKKKGGGRRNDRENRTDYLKMKYRRYTVLAFFIIALFWTGSLLAAPAFVQASWKTPATAQTVVVTFPIAQTAHDTNVIVVGWNDTTAGVVSVLDANGNHYDLAGSTQLPGNLSQSIYYCRDILPSTNTVTVTFTGTAICKIRILEYSGLITPPTDGCAATGNSLIVAQAL
jgi:hypothetical protein